MVKLLGELRSPLFLPGRYKQSISHLVSHSLHGRAQLLQAPSAPSLAPSDGGRQKGRREDPARHLERDQPEGVQNDISTVTYVF
eukprot:s1357_g6.t1